MREARTVSRELTATAIPYGEKVPIPAGTTVSQARQVFGNHPTIHHLVVVDERGRPAGILHQQNVV